MSLDEGLLTRLMARVRALLHGDWKGPAGDRFRRTTKVIGDFADEHHLRPGELLGEGVELGRRKLEGVANHEFAESLKNFADAERIKIDVELRRRSLQSDAKKRDAEARKAQAEARIAEISAVSAELELLHRLNTAGVILHLDTNGNITALPLPASCDLTEISRRNRLIPSSHLEERSDGLHIIRDYFGAVVFADKHLIIDSGVTVEGEICGLSVVILAGGRIKGNIQVEQECQIRAGGTVEGDITTQMIRVEDGSWFKGTIDIRKP